MRERNVKFGSSMIYKSGFSNWDRYQSIGLEDSKKCLKDRNEAFWQKLDVCTCTPLETKFMQTSIIEENPTEPSANVNELSSQISLEDNNSKSTSSDNPEDPGRQVETKFVNVSETPRDPVDSAPERTKSELGDGNLDSHKDSKDYKSKLYSGNCQLGEIDEVLASSYADPSGQTLLYADSYGNDETLNHTITSEDVRCIESEMERTGVFTGKNLSTKCQTCICSWIKAYIFFLFTILIIVFALALRLFHSWFDNRFGNMFD